MGDRTTVILRVLAAQAKDAEALFSFEADSEFPSSENPNLICYEFNEINYGTLGFLPKLIEAGIAYETDWQSGVSFGPGVSFARFDEHGFAHINEVSDFEANPSLDKLIELIDKPEELRQYILDYHRAVTPLPWDNQVKYGKIYRAKMLLVPKE